MCPSTPGDELDEAPTDGGGINPRAPAIKDFELGTIDDAMAPLMDATVLSCIASYAQGMELLRIASQDLDYELHAVDRSDLEGRVHHSGPSAEADSGCFRC